MEQKKSVFETLNVIDVSKHIEKKGNLSYLSWAWAWATVKKSYPDAKYTILETKEDADMGFMCHTEVTIEGESIRMWLPVMDGANNAMKRTPYTYKAYQWKDGKKIEVEKKVEAATMFDINKTIMRCLVKNLAMFGLGLYIYAGEDLPEPVEATPSTSSAPTEKVAEQENPESLPTLKKDAEQYTAVMKYVEDNAVKGVDFIIQQISRKYTITPGIKKAITNKVNEKLNENASN